MHMGHSFAHNIDVYCYEVDPDYWNTKNQELEHIAYTDETHKYLKVYVWRQSV